MDNRDRDREFLAELQSMPLDDKVQRTIGLIGEWHNHFDNQVYVSLSGGKDSTVLADLDAQWCRAINQPLNLCFSNTGLEYPEIQKHVRAMKEYFGDKYGVDVNLKIVVPKMRFGEVISQYGYPLISKEVAEAIYYARRIKKPDEHTNIRDALIGTLPPKRERERERERERDGAAICLTRETGRTILQKRAELTGKRNSMPIGEGTAQGLPSQERTPTNCLNTTEENSEPG